MLKLAQLLPFWGNAHTRFTRNTLSSNRLRLDLQTLEDRLTPASPVFTSVATVSVPENTTAVLSATATDSDPDSTLTYSIKASKTGTNIDGGKFSITESGIISFKAAPNYETPTDNDTDNVYLVAIQVKDGTNTVTQNLTITVTNVNEAPTFTSATTANTIENSTSVQTVRATDPDVGATLTYSIPSTSTGNNVDGAKFAVSSSGVLAFVAAPNFEAPSDSDTNNIYLVSVQVSDGTNLVIQNITVTVSNIDEVAPTFTSSNTKSITENTTAVLTVTATDTDSNTGTLIYSISTNYTGGNLDGSKFTISNTGALAFLTGRNFESPSDSDSNNTYLVTVTVSDGFNSAGQNIVVTVTNLNEPTIFTSPATATVPENTTAVLTVQATDPDAGTTLSYSISTTDSSANADRSKFSISNLGVLTFVTAPNFESPTDNDSNNVYLVTIKVSDGATDVTQNISVTVTNIDETAPTVPTTVTATVAENSSGTVLVLTSTDTDANAALTYSIPVITTGSNIDGSKFRISSTGILSFAAAPNFEAPTDNGSDNIYLVTVQVSDGTFTVTRNITVTVTNINEAPVVPGSVSVAENTTQVLNPAATDQDAGASLVYSIPNTYSDANADGNKFSISNSGVLSFLAAPNFEAPTDSDANNTYMITLVVSDGTNNVTRDIIVAVTNVNETAPVITSAATATIPENTTAIIPVTATDTDANTTFTYSIFNTYTGNNIDGAKFSISSSGNLIFTTAPNFEVPTDSDANNIYLVTVRVSDGFNVTSKNMVVTVTDATEASVSWALKSDEITTSGGTKSRDTQLTYIAIYSATPTKNPSSKDFLLTNAKVMSITQDSSNPLKFEVVIQPTTGSAPVTVTSLVKGGWNGVNSTPSAIQTISVFRSTSLSPRGSTGANPTGFISGSTTALNDLVFTFPQDINPASVDVTLPYTDDFDVVGCTITSVDIIGRTILVDATINSSGSPSDSGDVSIMLIDGAITDTYGNSFKESAILRWIRDNKAPTAILEITSGSGVVGQFVSVSVVFSEMITNFKPSMITVTLNGTPLTVNVTGSRSGWGFRFRVGAAGTINIGLDTTSVVALSRVADRAGNLLGSANSLTLTGFVG
ncbi:MAG: hypothetical protein EBS30_02855 [Planctomycetes bacterium]|nr:hypothetical protein [Planctomycetota bacterium]